MGKIKLLKEKVINQIAAGEVVERPLSIVKELIENSLDAYATNIVVELEKGGKKRISIKDNGHGMSEEDVFMSLERHATSKITEVEELTNVSTMGFRGEAIPSISAVSKFSISSAQEHGVGFKISSINGKIVENKPVSIPRGTSVEANSLFFNVPARRKFLKSDEREFALVRELIQKFAVTHPDIGFSLIHNDRQILTLPESQDLEQRILSIWKISNEDLTHQIVTRNVFSAQVWIPSPFASTPGISVTSVNGRVIRDRLVNAAVFRTFREVIGGEFKSPVMLFLEVPAEEVDINVHPSKLEVRFHNAGAISSLVSEAITSTLLMFREKPEIPYTKPKTAESTPYYSSERKPTNYSGSSSTFQPTLPQMDEIPQAQPEQDSFYSLQFRDYKVHGVLFGVYLVIEKEDTVIFLDQHASHERITFTSLQKNISLKSGLSQMLIAPSIVKLGPKEFVSVKEHLDFFNDSGFSVEIFDDESLIIRAVPAVGYDTDWDGIIKEMAGQFENYGFADKAQVEFLSHLATKACRASVKRNDPLTDPEIDRLLKDINESKVLTCPHGRPFFFTMTKNDFEKKGAPPMIILLGPTASGKTSISIELAKKLGGEIIGADSVQIYKDLIIGSAAPTIEEMAGIPHHLVGILNLSQKITAGEYVKMATKTAREIESRGKTPIMVGGTNFYVDAFINGLSPIPEISDSQNKDFDKRTDNISTELLYGKLLEKDCIWAQKISSPNDRQRIKRGLIVLEETGKKISDWNKIPRKKIYAGNIQVFTLEINRSELYQRINIRAEQMIKTGLVQELKDINNSGFNSLNCPALNSIGYKETEMFLKGELSDKEELIELIAKNTRHLAKRQLTWLRNRDYVNWINVQKSIEVILNTKNPI